VKLENKYEHIGDYNWKHTINYYTIVCVDNKK